jgi:hypothetical protein
MGKEKVSTKEVDKALGMTSTGLAEARTTGMTKFFSG